MRFRHITSGGHDFAAFEAGHARRLTCRDRRIRVERAGHVGLLSHPPVATSQAARSENGAHPPRGSRLPTRPLLLLSLFALSLFALLSCSSTLSFSNLISSILRAFVDQNQSNLLQEVEDSPIYKWVSFRRNFVGSFCHILV
jgi:hypothetical protein